MKWLIINTEAFSPKGLKQKKTVGMEDLPWVVRKFLSVFSTPFIVLDESSKIKVNTPMKESEKSSRTRTIKLLNKFGHRCIMTGTLMSKSPLNVVDQYNFLKDGYFPESMWELAERHCVMATIRVGRGRRVIVSQKDYVAIRTRLKNAYVRGGETQLQAAKESVFKQFAIDYAKQEHIIRHRKYTPFINQRALMRRISPDTVFVRREDVFDIRFDKFVKEPIMRKVTLSAGAKALANELITLGFTDTLVLGKAPALELMTRLQDVCNGFRPIEHKETKTVNGKLQEVRTIAYEPLPENPKLEALMELLEEIDVGRNQAVVWSSRKKLIEACKEAFAGAGYSSVTYDGDASDDEKQDAEERFKRGEAQIFLANQASGAYGLNCLAQCDYAIFICIDGSVEKYHQAQHRLLRGQLSAPKFSYHIYAEGTVEERQQTALKVGQELIGAENTKETFLFT
jgi:hypothetical protein